MMLTLFVQLLLVYTCTAEVANKYKDMLLEKHNELRRKQHGTNMDELVWDDTLANEADAWISRCDFKHENKGRGENLAFNTGTDEMENIDTAFKNWYDEINQYSYARKTCAPSSCHYTQLVWATTQRVGCAIKVCPQINVFGRMVKNGWFFGCWYDPKGNDVSEYPYKKGGDPCSACLEGQTCHNGLCMGEGKEVCEDKNEQCTMYAASNQCEENKPYMEKNCRQSCKLCTG
ncbi:peptidase inhibitor 15-A-like isoform X2 [Mercenaria mercenaria]|nr:peptidase inhibitor 15-A-like isoform X2 [Mercenaria mercenaria]